MSRRTIRTLLALFLVCVSGAIAIPGPAGAAPNAKLPLWAPDWMGSQQGPLTQSMALRQAGEFDVIISMWPYYSNYVGAMRQVNPSLRLYVYLNGVAQPDGSFPESWYAHSASGARIKFPQWNTFEMNPKSQGWINELIAECRDFTARSGYDGCFLDALGTSGVTPDNVTGLPINTSTGRVFTEAEWLSATTALAKQVTTAVAPRPVIGNGLCCGYRYFHPVAPSEVILGGLKMGMIEGFVRSARTSVSSYVNESTWKQDVDLLVDVAGRSTGNIALAITKVWTTATPAQVLSWHKYALATFLLGWVPGHAYFSFRSDKLLTTPSYLYDVNIGNPTTSYAKISGVYQRTFQRGKVLVNPTSSTFTIQLGRSYTDTEGHTSTSITLGPHAAAILTAS